LVERVLHSIRTLSIETKLHPKRLRKLLRTAGVLSEGSDDLMTEIACSMPCEALSSAWPRRLLSPPSRPGIANARTLSSVIAGPIFSMCATT
jgi:hypothetical protein